MISSMHTKSKIITSPPRNHKYRHPCTQNQRPLPNQKILELIQSRQIIPIIIIIERSSSTVLPAMINNVITKITKGTSDFTVAVAEFLIDGDAEELHGVYAFAAVGADF